MLVAIDIRYINVKDNRVTSGVDLFAVQILKEIEKAGKAFDYILLIDYRHEEFIKKELPQFRYIKFKLVRGQNRLYLIYRINKFRYSRLLNKYDFDFIWYPYFKIDNVYEVGIPIVYTVMDLIPLHERVGDTQLKKKTHDILERAMHIVTISEYVKKDIESFLHLTNKKIDVISVPVDVDISEKEQIEELVGKRFVLDINAYQKRKNATTLMKAFSKLKNNDIYLVFCGGYDEADTLLLNKNYAQELGIENKVFFYYKIPLSKRNWLLENCEMLVSPSLSEGFGKSPIEAAICEKPVISTKVDSLYEVTFGKLNYYDNPLDVDELKSSMEKLLKYKVDINKLSAISNMFKNAYMPKTIANNYMNLFEEIKEE